MYWTRNSTHSTQTVVWSDKKTKKKPVPFVIPSLFSENLPFILSTSFLALHPISHQQHKRGMCHYSNPPFKKPCVVAWLNPVCPLLVNCYDKTQRRVYEDCPLFSLKTAWFTKNRFVHSYGSCARIPKDTFSHKTTNNLSWIVPWPLYSPRCGTIARLFR